MANMRASLLVMGLVLAATSANAQLVYDKNAPVQEQEGVIAPDNAGFEQPAAAAEAAPPADAVPAATTNAVTDQTQQPAPAAAPATDDPQQKATQECLARAKSDYDADADTREAEREKLEGQLRKVCGSGQYDAVKIAMNEFIYGSMLKPRFDGIQACLAVNGESLPAKMDPKGKEIIADGRKYCQMLNETKP